MKRIHSINVRVLCMLIAFVFSTVQVFSQDFQRIKNRWKSTYIHNQNGPLAEGRIQPGWWSAQWILEPVPGTSFVRIKNRWKNTYIHNQNGKLEIGQIQPGWWSAQWVLEKVPGTNFVRIKNRWKNTYIHNQNGKLEIGQIQPGWWSAQWVLEPLSPPAPQGQQLVEIPGTNQKFTPAQLQQELRKGGLTLVQTDKLQPNQCALVYPNAQAGKGNASAEMGLLTCATKVNDNVSIKSTAVYGGCSASANMGAGAECEVGVASQDLTVNMGNNQTANLNIKGPSASACASASKDKFCANYGASYASTSFEVMDSRGNGIGIGVSAGVGGGLNTSYENGIISGSVNLRFIAGGSLTYSLNAKDAGTTIIKAGETGYVFAERQIVAAAPAMKRTYSNISSGLETTSNKVAVIAYVNGNRVVKFMDGTFQSMDRELATFFNSMEETGRTVYNWAEAATKGAKSPKLASGEGYISVFNQAGYVSKVSASYTLNGRRYSNSENISAGFTKEFFFPRGATSISMTTTGVSTIDKLNLKKSFNSLANTKKCYKVWGTIFDVEWAEQRCR